MHALLLGHSELIVHSGLQFGGVPIYSFKHEHEGVPPISRHCEFGPQGEGTHGFTMVGSGVGWGTKTTYILQ